MTILRSQSSVPLLMLLALTSSGCWKCPEPRSIELEHGLVCMFPGIEGGQWHLQSAYEGLRDAGVESAIHIHDWQRPNLLGGLPNLLEIERNRRLAGEIAERIATYAEKHPRGTIDLVGYSGGGGLAVMTAEALPPNVRLRHVILAHPAISPTYDLTDVLSHVDGKLVNFYSPFDWVILGLGTALFGTMDREFVASAGRDGFNLLVAVPVESMRGMVEQHDASKTHYGGHYGMITREWNRRCVGPYLREKCGAKHELTRRGVGDAQPPWAADPYVLYQRAAVPHDPCAVGSGDPAR